MKHSHRSGPKSERSMPEARAVLVSGVMLAFAAVFAACGQATNTGRLFKIPWPDAQGAYKVQEVAIKSFDRPETLQGRNVDLLVDPFFAEGTLQSAKPVGRFTENKKGVSVPADYASSQAAVVHAHFERLRELDEQLGVQLNWPMKIGINANIVGAQGTVVDNAIYDGKLNALLVVPYKSEKIPVAMNAGVLAHEHFHMIFQALVLNQLPAELTSQPSNVCEWDETHAAVKIEPVAAEGSVSEAAVVREYNSFYLRALNEGLADYWAWVYSGDTDFVSKSLSGEEGPKRRLDVKVEKLKSMDSIRNDIDALLQSKVGGSSKQQKDANEYLKGVSYRVGTPYARSLVEASLAAFPKANDSREARLLIARSVLEALPQLAEMAMNAQATGKTLSTDETLQLFQRSINKVSVSACSSLEKVRSFETGAPSVCVSEAK